MRGWHSQPERRVAEVCLAQLLRTEAGSGVVGKAVRAPHEVPSSSVQSQDPAAVQSDKDGGFSPLGNLPRIVQRKTQRRPLIYRLLLGKTKQSKPKQKSQHHVSILHLKLGLAFSGNSISRLDSQLWKIPPVFRQVGG